MPPRGDDPAVLGSCGSLLVHMKVLWVEFPCEVDDLLFAHSGCSEIVRLPWLIVLEKALVRRCGETTERHLNPRRLGRKGEALRRPPEKVGSPRKGRCLTPESVQLSSRR